MACTSAHAARAHVSAQAENATSKQSDLVRVAENTRKNLENEING